MISKVLLADDSQTIQKVIEITLANEPYDLKYANTQNELVEELQQNTYEIILLDFNLSDELFGYNLIEKVKELAPHSSIVILLGTFDSIDEKKLEDYGISLYIKKPFDSSEFIELCRKASDVSHTQPTEANSQVGNPSSDLSESNDEDENWEIDDQNKLGAEASSQENKVPPPAPMGGAEDDGPIDPLARGLKDWGMEVPGVILEGVEDNGSNDVEEAPIVSEGIPPQLEIVSDHDAQYPAEDDLEYPEPISEDTRSFKNPLLDQKNDVNESNGEVDSSVSQEKSPEDTSEGSDFWSPDEVIEKKPVESIVSQEKSEEGFVDSSLEGQVEKELIEKLTPMIRQLIHEECEKITEKVAWEIIPDLAENLIRKELAQIAESVIKQKRA